MPLGDIGFWAAPQRLETRSTSRRMAEVHEAEHQDLHPRHTLKLIKPEIVNRQGNVVIACFGLVRLAGAEAVIAGATCGVRSV